MNIEGYAKLHGYKYTHDIEALEQWNQVYEGEEWIDSHEDVGEVWRGMIWFFKQLAVAHDYTIEEIKQKVEKAVQG